VLLTGVVGGAISGLVAEGNDVHGMLCTNNGGTATSGLVMDQVRASDNGAGSGLGSGVAFNGDASSNVLKRLVAFGNDEAGVKFFGGATANDVEYSLIYDNPRGVWYTADHGVNNRVTHCTIVDNTTAGIALTGNGAAAPAAQILNNIIYANAAGILADADGTGVLHQIDFNLYDGHTGDTAIVWDEDAFAYTSIDGFNALTDNEVMGIGDVNPLFADYANNSYAILADSPAIRRGTATATGPDMRGLIPQEPPAIGAYESPSCFYFPSPGGG
jgi:hypothetical protein